MANVVRSVQSRLKSRKVLGVGENADGNIPRSKISQLLGHNDLEPWTLPSDHYPIGLRVFQWMTCLYFTAIGTAILWRPSEFYVIASSIGTSKNIAADALVHRMKTELASSQSVSQATDSDAHDMENLMDVIVLPVRMYGAATLSLAVLFLLCTFINRSNRRAVRIALIVEAIYFVCEIAVSVSTLIPIHKEVVGLERNLLVTNAFRVIAILLCAYYHAKTFPCARDIPRKNQE